jgi:hypothetical protein
MNIGWKATAIQNSGKKRAFWAFFWSAFSTAAPVAEIGATCYRR